MPDAALETVHGGGLARHAHDAVMMNLYSSVSAASCCSKVCIPVTV